MTSNSADKEKEQLRRYAEDLAKVYQVEKQQRVKLEESNKQLAQYARDLNETIVDLRKAQEKTEQAYREIVERLVLAAEYKDEDTAEHIVRMSHYSALLAQKVGFPDSQVKMLLNAAPMHDIGKIGIPDHILMKKGKLTPEEFNVIKTHPRIGAKILAGSTSELLQMAEQIAFTHHEKWDGSGYPRKLRGTNIPIFGRIVALADVFDALTSRRPYKEPMPVSEAVEIITLGSGSHFDPNLVNLFLAHLNEFVMIRDERIGSDG